MAEKKPTKTKEPNSELMALYNTDNLEEIYKQKDTEKQERTFNGKPKRVELSADECRKLCKKVGLDYIEGYEARVIEYKITDETPDRYGDIVRAGGVDFKTNYYPNNPTVQYAHNYGMLPVGKTIKIWKEDKSVMAWALFYTDAVDNTGFSETVFKFVSTNAMPAVSIGFLPIESNRPKKAEDREKIGLGEWGTEFKKVDLLEYSPCSIGANPNALKNSLIDSTKRGIFNKDDVEHIEKIVPVDIFEEIKKELEEQEPAETLGTFVEGETIDIEKAVETAVKEALDEKISPMIEKTTELMTKIEDLQETIKQLNITLEPKDPPDSTESGEREPSAKDIYSILEEDIKIGEGSD